MSFERLRLVLRDLAAGAAFAAMAISGQVPLWTVALFLIALAVAVAGRRPLADGRLSAVALLLARGAEVGLESTGGLSVKPGAGAFHSQTILRALARAGEPGGAG